MKIPKEIIIGSEKLNTNINMIIKHLKSDNGKIIIIFQ